MIKFESTPNGLVATMNVTIPVVKTTGFEESECDARNRRRGYICDVIEAFSARLIASLERRAKAQEKMLLEHLANKDCVAHNECLIVWTRKDGTEGHIDTRMFEAIDKAISLLMKGEYLKFASSPIAIGETIEALLNDTEQDHSDSGKFRYSELSKILTSNLLKGGER